MDQYIELPPWKLPFKFQPAKCPFHLVIENEQHTLDTIHFSTHSRILIGRLASSATKNRKKVKDYELYSLSDSSISRKHALILQNEKNQVYIVDLKSSHGTFVNEERIKPHNPMKLRPNDSIRFGKNSTAFRMIEHNQEQHGTDLTSSTPENTPTAAAKENDPQEEKEVESSEEEDTGRDIEQRYRLPFTHELLLPGHTKSMTTIAVDAAGVRVATGSMDFDIKLWDFGGMARQVRSFRNVEMDMESKNPIVSLSYSPSGALFLATSTANQCKIYDRDGLEQMTTIKGDMYIMDMLHTRGHTHPITYGQWNPESKIEWLTSSLDGTIRQWRLDGKINSLKKELENSRIWKIKSRQGKRIGVSTCVYKNQYMVYLGTEDGQIQAFDTRKKGQNASPDSRILEAHSAESKITSLVFSPNEYYLASRSLEDDEHSGSVKLWDVRNTAKVLKYFRDIPTRDAAANCAFNTNNTALVVPIPYQRSREAENKPGSLRVYDCLTDNLLEPVKTLGFQSDESAVCVNWSPVLNQLFVGMSNGNVKVLYDPEISRKGAMLSATRQLRPKLPDHLFANINANSSQQIYNPNSLKMYRDENDIGRQSKKRQADRIRRDPKRSKMPEKPVTGPGVGGKLSGSANFTQYFMQNRIKTSFRSEDPREAILKYADSAAKQPTFLGEAYSHTQPQGKKLDPRYQLASQTLEEEQEQNPEEGDH